MKKGLKFDFTDKAKKQYANLDYTLKVRIAQKLDYWESQENPLSFAEPVVNIRGASHRFRVGDYRLIVQTQGEKCLILIVKAAHRSTVYGKK